MTLNDKINEVAERVANSPITIRDPHGIKAIAAKIRPLVRELLQKHGRHKRFCPAEGLGPCSCGFNTLLAEIGESDEPKEDVYDETDGEEISDAG